MSDTIFSILVDMAEKERGQQSKRLADTMTRLRGAQEQLAMLEKYCADYAEQRAKRAAGGTSSDGYRNFATFIAKLDAALNHQRRDVAMWETRCEEIRVEQSNAHRKMRSFETLRDKRAEEARMDEAKRAQKADDEFASRSHARRTAEHPRAH